MSAYIHPPGVVNPSPWEQALAATKQDTGGNAYTGNAWQNYNTPQDNGGFNFTQDPYFNAAADRPNWDLAQTGAKSETDRARVWRWTLDQLKGQGLDPGKADQATVQRAYLGNIARLKRDYQANGMNWAGSAYAGYDQFLGGQPGATQQGGTRGGDGQGGQYLPGSSLPGGGMSIDYAGTGQGAQAQGGDGMGLGSGLVSGAQSASDVLAERGKQAAAAAQAALGGTSSPNGGTSHTTPPGLGTMGGDPLYNYGLALNGTAQDRARLIGEANGRSTPAHGRLAEFATNLYANALKAYLMISQLGGGGAGGADGSGTGVGDMNSFLAAMQGGGGGIIPLLQGGISKGLGGNLGQDPETQEQAYRAAIALRSLYSGGLASDVAGQNLDDAMWQQGASVDRDPLGKLGTQQSLIGILNQGNSPYKANLTQYLGLR